MVHKTQHVLQVRGPELERPFRIVSGAAAVHALVAPHNICILPGGTWPGLGALDDATADRLQACSVTLTPGAELDLSPTDAHVAEGLRAVQAQLLGRGSLAGRVAYLAQLGVPSTGINHTTLGALVGASRENAAGARRRARASPGKQP